MHVGFDKVQRRDQTYSPTSLVYSEESSGFVLYLSK